jgi:peptidoglycan hydrolase-like protein with peptidoglycan-binding domain
VEFEASQNQRRADGTVVIVAEGDCITSIAEEHGFFPDTIWNHPDNAELKRLRKDPNVLQPGDKVYIPEKDTSKTESCQTEQLHRFRRRGVPAMLKIRLLADGKPRANTAYRLVVDGQVIEGQTDGDGFVEQPLPHGAQAGELIIDNDDATEERHQFNFGTVDPIDTEAGQRHRLADLGYNAEDFEKAIRAYQRDHGLEVTGQADTATRDKLAEEFGQ